MELGAVDNMYCPNCRYTDFILHIPIYFGKTDSINIPLYTSFEDKVVCKNCGNTYQIFELIPHIGNRSEMENYIASQYKDPKILKEIKEANAISEEILKKAKLFAE